MSRVLFLCCHALSEVWDAPLSVTPDQFEQQIGWLRQRCYKGATFAAAVAGRLPSARTLVVTFGGAFRSVRTRAFPVLQRLGLPATVFVPTAFPSAGEPLSWPGIDIWQGSAHENELTPLSWEELRELGEAGWEVGSHTRTHPDLTELGGEELGHELTRSKHDCEHALDRDCISLAYPYGAHDDRVVAAARRAGYSAAATLHPGRWGPRIPLRAPRAGVYHGDRLPRFKLKAASAWGSHLARFRSLAR